MYASQANQGSYDHYNNELEGEFDVQALRAKPEPLDNLVKMTKFDRRELKLIYRGFKQICPLGVVKEDKFKLIYAQFFPRCADTNSYARFVFNSFDTKRQQEITFTDFVVRLSILTRGSIDEKIRWIFTLYDLNGDGIITRDEFSKVVGSIYDIVGNHPHHQRQPLASSGSKTDNSQRKWSNLSSVAISNMATTNDLQQEVDDLFKKFDLNLDGVVTVDEFREACKRDRNIISSISVFNTVW